jgi:hypothetical protein
MDTESYHQQKEQAASPEKTRSFSGAMLIENARTRRPPKLCPRRHAEPIYIELPFSATLSL